ncbi:MAG: RDD family protein [Bernardetiaceae bacterium]
MRDIHILTTQNVSIRYELANARDRSLATIIDFAVLILLWIALMWLNDALLGIHAVYSQPLLVVFLSSYHLLSEIFLDGQSLGKRALGLRVVKINGLSPQWSDYVLRWVFRMIDITFSVGTIAIMTISGSKYGQRLGDFFAGTAVVRLRASYAVQGQDLIAEEAQDYTPKYPEVVRLSESDMLTIKAVLYRQGQYQRSTYIDLVRQTSTQVQAQLGITSSSPHHLQFLQDLLKDYIKLTR